MIQPSATGVGAESTNQSMVSRLARDLIGSEVLRIGAEVRALQAAGRPVLNLTVGDFDPREFPIPAPLLEGVRRALEAGHTNYPPSNGVLELREAVTRYVRREFGLETPLASVLVAGGARPLIYATYRGLVDPGDAVAYPVPSWNNNHYCHLAGARPIPLEVRREDGFHPTPAQVAEVLPRIRLLALCTPLNPTGTTMSPSALEAIAQRIVEENEARRARGERPVFLLFDHVYWSLDFEPGRPAIPSVLVPEVAPYTVHLDAISKSWAATGLRVGWLVADPQVTARLSDLLGHVGAWAPKAEQVATAAFLDDAGACAEARAQMQRRLRERLELLHRGLTGLRAKGHPVDAVEPQGTLYLSVHFDLFGVSGAGAPRSNEEIRRLLLERAGIAVVPFQAFGLEREDGWFRMSVGAVSMRAIEEGLGRLERLLEELRG